MSKPVRVAIDAMGGDFGPSMIVPGAAIALQRRPDLQLIMVGDQTQINAALAAHPHLFPPLYVGLVRAGERSGDIDSAFSRLADQLDRDEQLRGRVLSASIYPFLLAFAGTIAVSVLIFFVLPRFVTLLEGSGAKLPASLDLKIG